MELLGKENVIKDVVIMTQNIEHEIIYGDIRIENDRIAEIKVKEFKIEGKNKIRIAMPALYNLHMHFGETIFRAQCDYCNLSEYLDVSHNTYLKENWKQHESEIHSVSTKLTLAESIAEGIGFVVGNRSWEEMKQAKMPGRALYPLVNIEKLKSFYDQFDDSYIKKYGNALFLQSIYLISKEKLEQVSSFMKKNNSAIAFIHVSETNQEIDYIKKMYGMTPVEYLNSIGLLHDRMFLVHCVHLTDHDFELIRDSKAHPVLCPVSNLKLQDGIPDFAQFIKYGIDIIVGTDGFATNNSASLFEEVKLISLLAGPKIKAGQLFDMITKIPAEAVWRNKEHGCIEIGNYADIAVFETKVSNCYTLRMLPESMLYNYNAFHCKDVMMLGNYLMEKNQLKYIDEERSEYEFAQIAKDLFEGEL